MISRLRSKLTASTLFILTAGIFGIFFVFVTPLLWGADETSHTGRVYQIAHGQIFSKVVNDKDSYSSYGFGGAYPSNLKAIVNYVNHDFNANSQQVIPGVKWVDYPADYQTFSNTKINSQTVDYNFSNTAIYSPLSYIPSVIAFIVSSLLNLNFGPTIHLARLFDLIFYIAVIAYVLYSLRAYKAKWIIFTLALLPQSLFQASTISADPVTIALSLLVVGLVMKSFLTKTALSKKDTIILAIGAILLPISKPTYIFISFLILLVPSKRIVLMGKYYRWVLPMSLILGLLLYGAWQYKTGYLSNAAKWIIAGVVPWWQSISASDQIAYVMHHPLDFIRTFLRSILIKDNDYFNGIFGRLGFSYVQVPGVAIVASFTALLVSLFGSEALKIDRKRLLSIGLILLTTVAALFGALYVTISGVGQSTIEGVQGRYLLPAIAILFLFLLFSTSLRLDTDERKSERIGAVIVCMVTISLLISAIKYYYITWG
jgi:uncharacterized membrane protein